MRALTFALLLASAAFSPAVAQEGERTRDDIQAARAEARSEGRGEGRRVWGGAFRGQPQPSAQSQQAAPPQPMPAARPERGRSGWGDASGWGNRGQGDNQGWRGRNRDQAPQVQTQPVPQAAPPVVERRRVDVGNDGNRGGWDRGQDRNNQGDWRGRDRNRDGNRDRDRNWDRGQNGGIQPVPAPQPGGNWDRNGNGRVDRNWDRNNNGRVDRTWDRNRDGNLDRRWDRNRDGNLDRTWDRNRDGTLDRRWDRNRDGRYDRGRDWNREGWSNSRRWDRGWHNDRRYDWRGYRNQYRHIYRQPRYSSPYGYGYGYNRFSIGIYLDRLFYSDRYWVNDPWRYRLPDAYGPYRWVRYHDDVLLVDLRSGYVVDVIHNFFW